MSLALLFHCLMLSMFRMLIHPSSGACDLFVELFRGLYCSGSMCVGVTLWFGCGGVVSVYRLRHYSALLFHYLMLSMFPMLIHPSSGACDLFVELFRGLYCSGSMCVGVTLWWYGIRMRTETTPPQPNHNVTPTHIEPEQYNPWNNWPNKSQAPEDGCVNIRNMLSIK